jgi:hypothetical protein
LTEQPTQRLSDTAELVAEGEGYTSVSTGSAQIRDEYLDFRIRAYGLDIGAVTGRQFTELRPTDGHVEQEDRRRYLARRGIEEAEALEAAISADIPQARLRVLAQIDEPTAGGPGGDLGGTLIAFLVADDPIGRIGSLIAVAQGAIAVRKWLRDKHVESILIDDGTAVWLASEVAFEATGSSDLTFNSVTRIKPMLSDWEGDYQGFLVTFREESRLVEVTVSRRGAAGPAVIHDIGDWSTGD